MKAVQNILTKCTLTYDDDTIIAVSKDPSSLMKIYEQARSRAILGVLGRMLEDNMIADTTWFYLNKQAAYVGVVSVCEEEAESPLGPIKIIITSEKLPAIMNWLAS
jgi:hypothetical protein